jgi:hypothetical protein
MLCLRTSVASGRSARRARDRREADGVPVDALAVFGMVSDTAYRAGAAPSDDAVSPLAAPPPTTMASPPLADTSEQLLARRAAGTGGRSGSLLRLLPDDPVAASTGSGGRCAPPAVVLADMDWDRAGRRAVADVPDGAAAAGCDRLAARGLVDDDDDDDVGAISADCDFAMIFARLSASDSASLDFECAMGLVAGCFVLLPCGGGALGTWDTLRRLFSEARGGAGITSRFRAPVGPAGAVELSSAVTASGFSVEPAANGAGNGDDDDDEEEDEDDTGDCSDDDADGDSIAPRPRPARRECRCGVYTSTLPSAVGTATSPGATRTIRGPVCGRHPPPAHAAIAATSGRVDATTSSTHPSPARWPPGPENAHRGVLASTDAAVAFAPTVAPPAMVLARSTSHAPCALSPSIKRMAKRHAATALHTHASEARSAIRARTARRCDARDS